MIYSTVSDRWETLTLNAPYPSCQAKLGSCRKVSWIQADDPRLINWIALATAMVVGSDSSRCTWSATPPIHAGLMPFCRAIPPSRGTLGLFSTSSLERRDSYPLPSTEVLVIVDRPYRDGTAFSYFPSNKLLGSFHCVPCGTDPRPTTPTCAHARRPLRLRRVRISVKDAVQHR